MPPKKNRRMQTAMMAHDDAEDEGVKLTTIDNYLINDQIEIPRLAAGQVLVRVQACCLNREDLETRDSIDGRPWPRIPGEEIVGIVSDYHGTAAQFNYHKFQPGDRVFGQPALSSRRRYGYIPGGLQQYCILDAKSCCLVPSMLNDAQAVTIPRDCFRAFCLMFATKMGRREFTFPPEFSERSVFVNAHSKTSSEVQSAGGERDKRQVVQHRLEASARRDEALQNQHRELHKQAIVILGAASPVGKFVLQIARMMHFGRIIAVAPINGGSQKYGATHVIDERIHLSVIQARVAWTTQGRISRVIDCVGQHPDFAVSLAVSLVPPSRPGAGLVVTNYPARSTAAKVFPALYRVFTPDLRHPSRSEVGEVFWAGLHKWIKQGHIKPLPSIDIAGGLNPMSVNFTLHCYGAGVEWRKHVVYPNRSGLWLGNTGLGSCIKEPMKPTKALLKRWRLSNTEEDRAVLLRK